MKRIKVAVAAVLIGVLVSLTAPVEAQNVTNAVVIQALQAMGLFGTGYADGQVPAWSTSSRRYLPATILTGLNPVFTGQLTGPTNNTCVAPTYSATGQTGTGMSISTTPSILLGVSGTCRVTISASAVTSTVPIEMTGTATLSTNGATLTFANNFTNFSLVNGNFTVNANLLLGGADLFLTRESAAVLQMGVDAAGVTDQMFKGPDRITSDGPGGAVYFAGGRNRGASAGGSLIFQTSLAAGAGVTGTLATALTIDSTKLATFTGSVGLSAVNTVFWGLNTAIETTGVGLFTLRSNTSSIGIGLDVATDGLLKIRDRAQTGTGSIGLGANLAIAGTAPTATGTGMAFTVGTGSTSFDWSITITTANAQSAFTLTLPTATNAWTCVAQSFTNPGTMKISMSARAATTATLTQYSQVLGTAANYADNDVIVGTCTAH